MNELDALHALAHAMGVSTSYLDGLRQPVPVSTDTLVRVCAALGAPITRPADAAQALRAHQATRHGHGLPPVIVAWDGHFPRTTVGQGLGHAELRLAHGDNAPLEHAHGALSAHGTLPHGYHLLTADVAGRVETATVISAPVQAFRRPGSHKSWGVGTHLAALRSARSRALGDLADLEALCRWVRAQGGDLVTVLPLLPTFNDPPAEPSPYSPVSRLFWSELILDLGTAHRPASIASSLDVTRAAAEVRAALADHPVPELSSLSEELVHYARFRAAQARLGRNWRDWPAAARAGTLSPDQVDSDVERFHLVAQTLAGKQLHDLRGRLDADGMRLGLDLAVGVHPDGYDTWSRQSLFGEGMSVGAPPDEGFPSGQDWGFSPVLPEASRREGHRYIAGSVGHQASLAGVLRVDHIMAWTRLYWIPHGMGLHQGTYVSYPADELFAILTLESERHRCEVVGENLGTVPKEIDEALPRHRIWGMGLAQFDAYSPVIAAPTARNIALVGSHDTPPFMGWIEGVDVAERVQYRLLAEAARPLVQKERDRAIKSLAQHVHANVEDARHYLGAVLDWLGRSDSPLVIPWLEDFWLERIAVNLPGTPSSVRPNWQRPMRLLLDDMFKDPDVKQLAERLAQARRA